MPSVKWTEKYRPKDLSAVLGNQKAVSDLRRFAASWESSPAGSTPKQRAAILYGPAGIGKTSAALALAFEMNWDYIEMNASDQRTASELNRVAGPASNTMTFSGKRRLVILDEADNLHGNADRGGAAAMLRLVRQTRQPVILIANEYYEIEKTLRDACLGIQFRSIRASTMASALKAICQNEGIDCSAEALIKISEMAGGDLRSAINDLQAASLGQNKLDLSDIATSERDVKSSIFKVLETIFKGKSAADALKASYSLDESPEDFVHWIDENLPSVYVGPDLLTGFESLARSDVFLGRVRRRQNYSLWRYANFFMTGGIQASKTYTKRGYVAFKPPSLWRRLGQTRRARNVRDSAAAKMASHCHVGVAYSRLELTSFLSSLLKNKALAPKVSAELDLNADEIALLIQSTPSTKKVQSIFEEAQRLREEERVKDIEIGWSGIPPSPSSPDTSNAIATATQNAETATSKADAVISNVDVVVAAPVSTPELEDFKSGISGSSSTSDALGTLITSGTLGTSSTSDTFGTPSTSKPEAISTDTADFKAGTPETEIEGRKAGLTKSSSKIKEKRPSRTKSTANDEELKDQNADQRPPDGDSTPSKRTSARSKAKQTSTKKRQKSLFDF